MTGYRGAAVRVLCGLAVVLATGSAAPGSAAAAPSPPVAMEEVEVFGSGELPERLLVPAPAPAHAAVPVHVDILRERILAPISPWENDDEDLRAGVDGVPGDGRD